MIRRALRRHWYPIAVVALSVVAGLAGAFAFVNVVLPEMTAAGYFGPAEAGSSASQVPSASPSASPGLLMHGALLPADANCYGCHLSTGSVIGPRPIPSMAHPLEGWSQCTACHATASLVNTAPGHTGIHATECLLCHQPGKVPAPIPRPHRDLQNTACLECHGSVAPLPADMAHRSQTACWLCHRLPTVPPPVPAHQTGVGETDCMKCHVAGGVGALPADHIARTASECLLCHAVPVDRAPPGPPLRLFD